MQEDVRICWISASFYPQNGGLQTYNLAVTKRLAEMHELHLILADGLYFPEKVDAEIHTCVGLEGSSVEIEFLATGRSLNLIIEQINPQIIHLGDAGMSIFMEFFPKDIPVISTIHGNDFTSPWILAGKRNVLALILIGLNKCRLLLAVSNYTHSLLTLKKIQTPVIVIHNTCELENYFPKNIDRKLFCEKYGLHLEWPIILTVGRLAPRKGHLFLLHAIRKLDYPVNWLIIGQGKWSWRIKLARTLFRLRNVVLPGWVSKDELLNCYNACDLFVLVPDVRKSSRKIDFEGFGIVYHEAAACEKPAIASDAGGCPEAVIHSQTGIVIPSGQRDDLILALNKLLLDSDFAKQMGMSGRAYVLSLGGWESISQKISKTYLEIL